MPHPWPLAVLEKPPLGHIFFFFFITRTDFFLIFSQYFFLTVLMSQYKLGGSIGEMRERERERERGGRGKKVQYNRSFHSLF